jgi:isopentenyldiphosphate isomerase
MKELLEIYNLKSQITGIQERSEFYKEIKEEFKRTGKITKKVRIIRLLLLTSEGRIYIQKRSETKEENPSLYDKTIGGHIKAGHTWDLTVVQECHEELGFPAVVLSDDEFRMAVGATDLKIIGLFRKVDYIPNLISIRKTKEGDDFKQPYMCSFYIGYYDGSIRFCDGESTGIEVMTLEQLKNKIKAYPEMFAEDLKFMIKRYEKFIVPLEKEHKTVLGYEEEANIE